MAYVKTPKKKRIRKNDGAKKQSDMKLGISQIQVLDETQYLIDRYNELEWFKIDDYFKNTTLNGEYIIVRMFHENLVKYKDDSNPENIQIDAYFRQISTRQKTSDVESWMPTPFPYLEQGVIVALSPDVLLQFYKKKEELAKYDKKAADKIRIPKVGDIITVNAFGDSQWFKLNRFYIDKQEQCMDFVRNQKELVLNHFDHYFKVRDFEIVSFEDSDKTAFYESDNEPQWFIDESKKFEEKKNELSRKNNIIEQINSVEEVQNRITKELEKKSRLFDKINNFESRLEKLKDRSDKAMSDKQKEADSNRIIDLNQELTSLNNELKTIDAEIDNLIDIKKTNLTTIENLKDGDQDNWVKPFLNKILKDDNNG
jgi:hypothetical protein